MDQTSERRATLLYALVAALLTAAACLLTTAPGTVILESNYELTVAARHLGCAHSPGYPLHSLGAHLFCALLPADPTLAVNLFSGLWAAVAVFLLTLTLRGLGCRNALAALGALLFGLSATFWRQASLTEVYTQHLALTIAALHLALLIGREGEKTDPDLRPAAALGLVAGLLLVSHNASLTYLPALVVVALPGLRHLDLRGWALLTSCLLLGLSVYLYLPLRAALDPPINWSAPDTWQGFWRGLSHGVYHSPGLGRSGTLLASQLGWIGGTWWSDLAPGLLPLGLAGLLLGTARDGRRLRLGLLLLMLLPALGTLLLRNYELEQLRGSDETFLLTGALVLCLGLALGLERLARRLDKGGAFRRALPVGAAVVAVLATLACSLPRADLSRRDAARRIGDDILAEAPYRSLLVVSVLEGDSLYFDGLVRLEVLDQRPDLALSSAYLVSEEWARRELLARGGLRPLPPEELEAVHSMAATAPNPYIAQGRFCREYLKALARHNGRPLVAAVMPAYWEMIYIAGEPGRAGFRPYGLLELHLPEGVVMEETDPSESAALRRYRPGTGTDKYDLAADDFYRWRNATSGLTTP